MSFNIGNFISGVINTGGDIISTGLHGATAIVQTVHGVGDALAGNSGDAKKDFSSAGDEFVSAGKDAVSSGEDVITIGGQIVKGAEHIPANIESFKNIHSFGDFAKSAWNETSQQAKSFGDAIESNGIYIGKGFLSGAVGVAELGVDTVEAGVVTVEGLYKTGKYLSEHACDIAVGSALSAIFATFAADGEEEEALGGFAALAALNVIDQSKAHAAANALAFIITPAVWLIPGVKDAFLNKQNTLQDVIQFVLEHLIKTKRKLIVETAGQAVAGALIYTITDVVCSGKLPGGFVVWQGLQRDSKNINNKTNQPPTLTPAPKVKPNTIAKGAIKTFEKKIKFKVDKEQMIIYDEVEVPKGFKVLSGGGWVTSIDNVLSMCYSIPAKLNGANFYNGWKFGATNIKATPSKVEETLIIRALAIYDPNDLLDIDLMEAPIQIQIFKKHKNRIIVGMPIDPAYVLTGLGAKFTPNEEGSKWVTSCFPLKDPNTNIWAVVVAGENLSNDGEEIMPVALGLKWKATDYAQKYPLKLLQTYARHNQLAFGSLISGPVVVGGGAQSKWGEKITTFLPLDDSTGWRSNNDGSDNPDTYCLNIYGLPGDLFPAPIT
jgi:hypothetical protein